MVPREREAPPLRGHPRCQIPHVRSPMQMGRGREAAIPLPPGRHPWLPLYSRAVTMRYAFHTSTPCSHHPNASESTDDHR